MADSQGDAGLMFSELAGHWTMLQVVVNDSPVGRYEVSALEERVLDALVTWGYVGKSADGTSWLPTRMGVERVLSGPWTTKMSDSDTAGS
jgi:hypothetical protein